MIIGDWAEWYLDLDLVRHLSKARIALVPPVSIKDRPLHWILVRPQTYYPEHILVYGSREALLLSCSGFRLFPDRLIGDGDSGGLSTTLSPDSGVGAWSPSFDGDLDPLTGEWWVGSACDWGTSGVCVLGYLARLYWFTNRHIIRYELSTI